MRPAFASRALAPRGPALPGAAAGRARAAPGVPPARAAARVPAPASYSAPRVLCLAAPAPRGGRRARRAVPMNDAAYAAGGECRARTGGPLLAKQALYQLS